MNRTLVIDVVGLTPALMGEDTPNLSRFAAGGAMRPIETITPALTCSVQASFLTGELPRGHGIVGNGWFARELADVQFWKQSNRLMQGEKVWDAARKRDPDFTCAQLFWWFNMYASVETSITPRPMYLADGRKIPDIYTEPPELREELNDRLGQFPLFRFWGPAADISSSRWIADSARAVLGRSKPTLGLVYLPHLDYELQRRGPDDPAIRGELRAIDEVCGDLIDHAEADGVRVLVLSEYGVTNVDRPIHVNRVLREHGFLRVRDERGHELLDPGASRAFAVSDHQVAHIYVARPELRPEVAALVATIPGVETVLTDDGKRDAGLDHERSGDLVAISDASSWFTYYYFLDDERAPDFAHTVDIHRKPGYDPVELFVDPGIRFPRLAVGRKLLRKALGFRYLMDLIPLDAALVRGSHGRPTDHPEEGPLVIGSHPDLMPEGPVPATAVKELMLDHVFADSHAAAAAQR